MFKLFLFLILLVVIYAFRQVMVRRDNLGDTPSPAVSKEVETVLECACCGVLVPPSEGIRSSGQFYCCPEHARQGPRNKR